jgi:hypothetical protein
MKNSEKNSQQPESSLEGSQKISMSNFHFSHTNQLTVAIEEPKTGKNQKQPCSFRG